MFVPGLPRPNLYLLARQTIRDNMISTVSLSKKAPATYINVTLALVRLLVL